MSKLDQVAERFDALQKRFDALGEKKWIRVNRDVYNKLEKGKSYKIADSRFRILDKEEGNVPMVYVQALD